GCFFTYLVSIVNYADAWLQQAFAIVMQVQTGIVYFFLPLRKFAVYRNGTGKISIVAAVGRTKIHQYQLPVLAFMVITYIVQCAGPVAAGNDAAIGLAAGPLAEKGMHNFRLYLILHYTGFYQPHHPFKSFAGNGYSLFYYF